MIFQYIPYHCKQKNSDWKMTHSHKLQWWYENNYCLKFLALHNAVSQWKGTFPSCLIYVPPLTKLHHFRSAKHVGTKSRQAFSSVAAEKSGSRMARIRWIAVCICCSLECFLGSCFPLLWYVGFFKFVFERQSLVHISQVWFFWLHPLRNDLMLELTFETVALDLHQ